MSETVALTRAFACPLCEGPATRLHRLSHTDTWRCRDPRCDLRFAGPAPTEDELDDFYRTLYYPEVSRDGGCFEDTPTAIFEDLLGAVGGARGGRLLDFGAGRGALCRTALRLGLVPTGIERDPNARAFATRDGAFRAYLDLRTLGREEPDARFDTIVMWQVVEHLRTPWHELAELRDWLAPGGRLIVATPNANGLKSRLRGAAWDNVTNPTHLYYFGLRSLTRTLERAGYGEVERLRVVSDFPHHGPARRWIQRLLRAARLDGDLVVCARCAARED